MFDVFNWNSSIFTCVHIHSDILTRQVRDIPVWQHSSQPRAFVGVAVWQSFGELPEHLNNQRCFNRPHYEKPLVSVRFSAVSKCCIYLSLMFKNVIIICHFKNKQTTLLSAPSTASGFNCARLDQPSFSKIVMNGPLSL